MTGVVSGLHRLDADVDMQDAPPNSHVHGDEAGNQQSAAAHVTRSPNQALEHTPLETSPGPSHPVAQTVTVPDGCEPEHELNVAQAGMCFVQSAAHVLL